MTGWRVKNSKLLPTGAIITYKGCVTNRGELLLMILLLNFSIGFRIMTLSLGCAAFINLSFLLPCKKIQ